LYVNLTAAALAQPEHVRVFYSLAQAEEFASAQTQSQELQVPSSTSAAKDEHSPTCGLLAQASHNDLAIANHRYSILSSSRRLDEICQAPPIPSRTLRRWRACFRQAEAEYGSGFLGLLPRKHKQGNRLRKLPDEVLTLMEHFIVNEYEQPTQSTRFAAWSKLLRACHERGLITPSYQTFCLAVKHRPHHRQITKRRGERAAYHSEEFYHDLNLQIPRHGDRPFEIAHIDHTELDIELISSGTRRNLGRPWATFMTDAFSRRFLAVVLSFSTPSYQSCMMALRECVSRFGRLPNTLVMDGGREFESVYFETLLARFECIKKTRPLSKARFGAVCERLFGTTNTRFVYNLTGNTQMTKGNLREITPTVSPKNLAIWTFGELLKRLQEFAYEVYDTFDHPALGQSPREAFSIGLMQSGARIHRTIPFDDEFRILTLPSTIKGTAQVVPGRGVRINYIFYWSDGFRDASVEKSQVLVRYDPFDAGFAYAFVKNQWRQCLSEYHSSFKGRSVKEVMLCSAELRRGRQQHNRNIAITAHRLAEFLNAVQADEVIQQQRLRDAETRKAVPLRGGSRKNSELQVLTEQTSQSTFEMLLPEFTCSPDQLEMYEDYQ
ncbi:MAG: hypothetical protein ACRD9R_17445, partial [Pyrinomonadaceae bacterium]